MTEAKKEERDWSTRTGVVKPALEDFTSSGGKSAIRGTIVNGEGKEQIVEAFSDNAKTALKAAAESQNEMVIRGPAYFAKGNVPHVMIATCKEKAEPKAKVELTEDEKAARTEARAADAKLRDASRVLVDADSTSLGDKVEKDGAEQEVNHVGKSFEKDGKSVAYAYFGEMGAEMEAKKVEAEKEAEADSPSM